jgi:hypothetical protein
VKIKKITASSFMCACLSFAASDAFALPKIESSTRGGGVIAYQDENDANQFYIFPERIPLVLGLTLSDPSVKYWGIGATFRQQNAEYGLWVPVVGGTISGMATVTIAPTQEAAVRDAIKRDFNVANAKLAFLDSQTKTVQPVYAANTLGVSSGGDSVFPPAFRFGASFNFTVGSPASHTFASYVATRIKDQPDVTPDSSFGINLIATSQFRGAAWNVSCTANLQKVWHDVRQRYGASGGYGWLGISVDYQSIQQDLFRSKAIDCNLSEGDLAAKDKGEQLFQIAKDALTTINDPDNEFFRFQPNPQAPALGSGPQGAWLISINLAYSSASLKDEIKWSQSFTFKPTIEREMPVSLTLAVKCDVNTEQYFQELDVTQPCVTSSKARFFRDWAARETALKQRKLEEVMTNPRLTDQQRRDLVKFYSVISLTDTSRLVSQSTIPLAPRLLGANQTTQFLVGLSDEFFEAMEDRVARGMKVKDAIKDLTK